MEKTHIKNWTERNLGVKSQKTIAFIYYWFRDFNLFLLSLTGHIPSHIVRMILYKIVFKLDVSWNSIIYEGCKFFEVAGVHIGKHSIIGNNAFLDGRKGLYIGENVNIAGEVRIYTMEHDITSLNFKAIGGPVHIEDWAYIGTRVTILPNIKIKEGAVVASGCVVTKDVEPWTMVGGVPSKFIKNRPVVKYTLDTKKRRLFQ